MVLRVLSWTIFLLVLIALCGPAILVADDEEGTWGAAQGPVGFVTHIVADPDSPEFLMVFLAQSVQRNNDRTQTIQGHSHRSWAPYFSMDGGETWQAASNDLAHVEPTVLEITQGTATNTIWVGTVEHGLWRSENSGRTWRPVLVNNLENQRVVTLAVDARKRLQLLTLDNSRFPTSHLYTSTDNGYNWSHRVLQEYTGEPGTLISDLVADPFDANRLYAPTIGGLLYSEDAGFSWQQATIPALESDISGSETVLAVDYTQRGRLFFLVRIATSADDEKFAVFLSLDSAQTWEMVPAKFTFPPASRTKVSLRPQKLEQDPINRRQLFLATNNGLWLSDDAGLNWRLAGTALAGVSMSDFYLHPRQRGRWIATGSGGLWQTANGGSQWRAVTTGLPPASNLVSVAGSDNMLFTLSGGEIPIDSGRHVIWRSSNGGETWMPVMLGLEDIDLVALVAHPLDSDVLYGLANTGIVRTDNEGRSWQYIPLSFSPTDLVISKEEDHIFAASSDGMWRSTDKGESWQMTSLTGIVQAAAIAANGEVVAIVSEDGGVRQVWRSGDEGLTWRNEGAIPQGTVNELVAHPTNSNILALSMEWAGLYISRDGGRTWLRSDAGIPTGTRWRNTVPETPAGPNLIALFIDPEDPNLWWASRDGGGIYASTDTGQTWNDFSADLGDNLVQQFAHHNDKLVAGTSNLGLLERTSSALSQDPPATVDVRVEILWPHNYAPVTSASLANLGLRVYDSRSQEAPPCAWTPTVELWVARDSGPLRRLGLADQRSVDGHPFPFWEYNDVDVTWANDPNHKLIFLGKVSPNMAESQASPWIHAADARTYLPEPPQPVGLTTTKPDMVDALIRVVWPHDHTGNFTPPERANLVNISAVLVEKDTLLALAPEHLPERVWLIGSLDNQVGRRLAVGAPQINSLGDVDFTTFEFNNIDVSLARSPAHHWTFWLEVPELNASSNVWVHGVDSRTRAPVILEPIAGCEP